MTKEDRLFEHLVNEIESRGYSFRLTDGPFGPGGKANGVTKGLEREVIVNAQLPHAQVVGTVAHELAHIVLKHQEGRLMYDLPRKEVEAEMTSAAVLYACGITHPVAADYVAGWCEGDYDLVTSTLPVVEEATKIILDPLVEGVAA